MINNTSSKSKDSTLILIRFKITFSSSLISRSKGFSQHLTGRFMWSPCRVFVTRILNPSIRCFGSEDLLLFDSMRKFLVVSFESLLEVNMMMVLVNLMTFVVEDIELQAFAMVLFMVLEISIVEHFSFATVFGLKLLHSLCRIRNIFSHPFLTSSVEHYIQGKLAKALSILGAVSLLIS